MSLAIVGACDHIEVGAFPIKRNSRFTVGKGDAISVHPPQTGASTILAVQGGIQNSDRATVRLHEGDRIVTDRSSTDASCPKAFNGSLPTMMNQPLRIVAGPQSHMFDLAAFSLSTFRIRPDSSRMGIRLDCDPFPAGPEMVSEPAVQGAVQITNDGRPIILGPDGPTIGGYPKIAVVCSADLDRVGQLRPGNVVKFEWITLEQASILREESLVDGKRLTAIAKAL